MVDRERVSGVELGAAVVAELVEEHVHHVVLSPGSRNAPLAFAIWANDLDLHTRIDERSAGFLALGLSKVGARAPSSARRAPPSPTCTRPCWRRPTPGCRWSPLTADRPARLRATGANQTTDQVGIFGPLVPTYDVAEVADLAAIPWDASGPLHINVRLDEPLVPEEP